MARGVRRWFALPPQERKLLTEAALLVCGARLAVWLLPFRLLLRPVAFFLAHPPHSLDRTPTEMARQIARVSRYLPFSTCLVQALAGQWMLARSQYRSELCIGVGLPGGRFRAHAWLMHEGRVLLGEAESQQHRLLLKVGVDGLVRSA